jgi:hypothetical protein
VRLGPEPVRRDRSTICSTSLGGLNARTTQKQSTLNSSHQVVTVLPFDFGSPLRDGAANFRRPFFHSVSGTWHQDSVPDRRMPAPVCPAQPVNLPCCPLKPDPQASRENIHISAKKFKDRSNRYVHCAFVLSRQKL